jgi:uncharacterized membrane protein
MNTKNFLIGGLVGGVVYFLLGWLFYGNLMNQYFMDHPGTATNVHRPMEQMEWWALIAGNLLFGFLLAYVFSKSGVSTLSSGLITGGMVGLLACSAFDLTMYGTTNIASKSAMVADIAVFTIMSAIVGAVIGAVIGMMNRPREVIDTNV